MEEDATFPFCCEQCQGSDWKPCGCDAGLRICTSCDYDFRKDANCACHPEAWKNFQRDCSDEAKLHKYALPQNSSMPAFKNRILFEAAHLLNKSTRLILRDNPRLLSRPYLEQLRVVFSCMKAPAPKPGPPGFPKEGSCFLCDSERCAFYLFGLYVVPNRTWVTKRKPVFNFITQTANYFPPLVCADCESTKCSVGAYLTFFGAVFLVDTKIPAEKISQFLLLDKVTPSVSEESLADSVPEIAESAPLLPPKPKPISKLLLMQIGGRFWVLLYQLKKVFGLGWVRSWSERYVKENCPSARMATSEEFKLFNDAVVKKSNPTARLMVLLEEIIQHSTSMTLTELLKPYSLKRGATKNLLLTFEAGNIESQEIDTPSPVQHEPVAGEEQLVEFQMFWTMQSVPLRKSGPISMDTKQHYLSIIREYLDYCKERYNGENCRLEQFLDKTRFLSFIEMVKAEKTTKTIQLAPYFSAAIAVLKFLLARQLNGQWELSPLINEMTQHRNNSQWLGSSMASFSDVDLELDEPEPPAKKHRRTPKGSYDDNSQGSLVNWLSDDEEKVSSEDEDYNGSSSGEESDSDSSKEQSSESSKESSPDQDESLSCEIIPPPSERKLRRKPKKRTIEPTAPVVKPKRQKAAIEKLKSNQLAVYTSTRQLEGAPQERFTTSKDGKTLSICINETNLLFRVKAPLQTLAQKRFLSKFDKSKPNGKHIDALLSHLIFHAPDDDKIEDLIEHDSDRTKAILKYLVRISENPSVSTCTDIVRTFKFTSTYNEQKNLENLFSALARITVYQRIGSRVRETVSNAMDRVFAANEPVRNHGASNENVGDLALYCPELVESLLYLPITVLSNTAAVCVAYIVADERKHKSLILDALIEGHKVAPPDLRLFFSNFLK